MGNVSDEVNRSQQRFHADAGNTQIAQQDAPEQQVAALQQELAALRRIAQDKAALEVMVAHLREANQNLVLASVNAQSRRDDAEEANRRQNEFVAMLAHELRNPLAPIGMAAALLERLPDASPQALKFAQVIARQVAHMSHLLDDLLDAARISSGKISLALQPVSLAEVIEQAVETVNPRVRERGQLLSVELPPQQVVLHADKVRLAQVFSNLLGNASKYTAEGGAIMVSAALEGGKVVVAVSDNGSGIPAGLLPHVFDLFTQGERTLARSEGGLGVGLNVVRNLVGMHGGQVAADSAGAGMGSTFTVVLPLSGEPLGADDTIRTLAPAGKPLTILLVEDNRDARETLRQMLALEGHQVHLAHDGNSGLAAATGGSYDVLICDIGLPGMDGLELIGHVRRCAKGSAPYAIALSGYCQPEDRSRALDAGFDDYCVKPVSPDALLARLAARQSPAA